MNMRVKDALPACPADIDTDVESIGFKLLIDGTLLGHHEVDACVKLFRRKLKEVGAVTQWNNQ
jgi:hypothetical protein